MLSLFILGIISILIGTTYVFNLEVGNISFSSTHNGIISLTNIFPITCEELGEEVNNHD